MLYLASDHAGFEHKEQLKQYLDSKGVQFQDIGPEKFDPQDDYPDYAYPAVARMDPDEDKAILLCGSGGGMSILANKLRGVRATVAWDEESSKLSRTDDDANVLAIPSRLIDFETVKRVVDAWLGTEFSQADRHVRRLNKIRELEEKLSPGSRLYHE